MEEKIKVLEQELEQKNLVVGDLEKIVAEKDKTIADLYEQIALLKESNKRKEAESIMLDERLEELDGNRQLLIRAHDREKAKLNERIEKLEERLSRYEKDGKKKNFFQRLFNL